jgi:hypothetical protein
MCCDFVHALFELATWLQAGEDRAIRYCGGPAGGSPGRTTLYAIDIAVGRRAAAKRIKTRAARA